jgi:hypothetical protein
MPATIRTMPTPASHPTARQRREGTLPVGNSNSRNVEAGPAPVRKSQLDIQAARVIPGSSAGLVSSP